MDVKDDPTLGALLEPYRARLAAAGFDAPVAFAMGPFIRWMRRFRAYLGAVEKAMGALLVATGVAFLTGGMERAAYWLLETFPALGQLG